MGWGCCMLDLGLARDFGFLEGDPGTDFGVPLGVDFAETGGFDSGSGVCICGGVGAGESSSSAAEPRLRDKLSLLRLLSIVNERDSSKGSGLVE